MRFTYDSNGNLMKQSNGLEFFYDHSGVFAVKYNGSTYFYRKDAQGNVVALLDITGTVVVKYKYDAWGNCKAYSANGILLTGNTHIGTLNPFRYRSYYYDTETKLYFLKTRYYDPEVGRFMTIDDISYLDPESINGLNLYAYCLNNPVVYCDPNGTFVVTTAMIVGIIVGAIIGGTIGGITAYQSAVSAGKTGWNLVGATLLGVGTGAVLGAAVGGIIGAAVGGSTAFLVGGLSSVAGKLVSDTVSSIVYGANNFGTWEDYTIAFIMGALLKGLPLKQLGEVGMEFINSFADIIVRPFASQIVQVGTRGAEFNANKYAYNVITRWVTYKIGVGTFSGNMFGREFKLSFGKSIARGLLSGFGKAFVFI